MDSIIKRVNNITNVDINKQTFPTSMKLEMSGICNHKCSYCVVPTLKDAPKFMPEGVFYRSLSQAEEIGIKEIGLFHMGEGTLHPKFCNLLENISSKFNVFLTTNGTQLNQLEYCIEYGIKSLKFSLNGYNREIHKQVTGVDTFDLIINNLKKIVKYRDELHSPTEISASSIYYNTPEQDKFVEEISKIVDNFYFTEIFNHASKVKNKYIELSNDPRIITSLCQIPCYGLYNLCHIKANGDINLCKWGVDDEFVIGNILKDNIKDIWFSKKANKIREMSTNYQIETCNRCIGFKNDC